MSSGEQAINLARRMLSGQGEPAIVLSAELSDQGAQAQLRTAQGNLSRIGWQVGSSGGKEGEQDHTFAVPMSHFQPGTSQPDLERTQALLDEIISKRVQVSVGLLIQAA